MASTLTVVDPVLLAFAADVGPDGPVAIEGGRTRWSTGGESAAGTRLLTAPIGVTDYMPEEMTLRVRAGTPMAEVNAVLAEHGQRCALPSRGGTVGGAIAVGENDLDLLGKGRVRDAVLQVRYVSADGQIVTGGGPTVKNVSGFNLPKLMVGSLGTLGLLIEVILRTNPSPAASRWLVAGGVDPMQAFEAVLRPAAVLTDGQSVWVHLEGHDSDVEAETTALSALGDFSETDGPPALPSHRWSMTPDAISSLRTEKLGRYVAMVGVGTVFADQPSPTPDLDPVTREITDRMKVQFDPTGRLNPGRRL